MYLGVIATVVNGTFAQQPIRRIEPGEYADYVDEKIQSRIETELKLSEPQWLVTTVKYSPNKDYSHGSYRLLELKQGTTTVTVGITYFKSVEDAAKNIQYRWFLIQMPRFEAVKGVGDEAYSLTGKGPLLFRVQSLVVRIDSSDQSLDTEKAVAHTIVVGVHAA
jgi:hypothetical protein